MFEENEDSSYMLFLILILLFMGNSSELNSYYHKFENEMNHVEKMFKTLNATADGLKVAFETPQKVINDLEMNNY
ncbi:MAG: hypothetical protein ACQEQF_03860 [Bacillota bacterium]